MSNSVTVRFFAAAAEAAGVQEASVPLGAESVALEEFLQTLPEAMLPIVGSDGQDLATVCRHSSFLVNAVHAKPQRVALTAGDTLDILPPFAGG